MGMSNHIHTPCRPVLPPPSPLTRRNSCRYRGAAPKWNPIEHRLFSEISKNWAGRPLDHYETILRYAASTTTSTGLAVKAYLVRKHYPKGVQIPDEAMAKLRLRNHPTQPERNYTLSPRPCATASRRAV
jgi:hypothetical protein